MIPLTLPSEDRRVLVRSWWLTISVLSAVPWLALAWWLRAPTLVGVAAGVSVLIASVAWVRNDFVWRVYGAWNHRLVHPFCAVAARFVMAVCYFLVFVAAGRTGSKLRFSHAAEGSAWTARESLPRDAYQSLFAASSSRLSGAWVHDYVQWSKRTGHFWALALVPFIAMLRMLSRPDDGAAHENIYTLF